MSDPTPGLVVTAEPEGDVRTVFGRKGDVQPASGDYEANQVLVSRAGTETVAGALSEVRQQLSTLTTSQPYFVHEQGMPSTTWHVLHNLGRFPAVVVVDSAGEEWLGAVRHLSVNELVIEFEYAFSGTAVCN